MAFSDFPGDPVHRFFQMWQQVGNKNQKDLFVWVAETAGIGNHNDGFGTTPDDTHQGGLAMGFFNMNTGDAPFFKQMADFYAISDNYHQAIMGGNRRQLSRTGNRRRSGILRCQRPVRGSPDQLHLSGRPDQPGREPRSANRHFQQPQLVHRRRLPRRLLRQLRGLEAAGCRADSRLSNFAGGKVQMRCERLLPRQQLQSWLQSRWHA